MVRGLIVIYQAPTATPYTSNAGCAEKNGRTRDATLLNGSKNILMRFFSGGTG
jgi:hypothetical protein